jgi:hypothetical protein
MKKPNNPDAPCVRFAMVLLLDATKAEANELRLALGEELMVITQDGEDQPAPKNDIYQPTVQAILGFAGVRPRLLRKTVSGVPLNFSLAECCSSWSLESADIRHELILRRIRKREP